VNRFRLSTIIVFGALFAAAASAEDQGYRQPGARDEPINPKCPISGEETDPSAGTIDYKSHAVGFCCPGCAEAFGAWAEARKDEFVRENLAAQTVGMTGKPGGDISASVPAAGPSYPYTLDACPVSGRKLGSMGDPVVRQYDDREVRFCCPGCIEDFEANKAKYWAEIDAKIVEQQLMHYPLNTCIVTGEELGDQAINHVYKNRLVRLANAEALKAFRKNPAKHLAALDKKIVQTQLAAYPMGECPVGGPLGSMGEPVNFVYMNRLVRFCCAGCESKFVAAPARYMAKLDKAYADAQRGNYPLDTCVVSGSKLGSMGEPAELVAGTRLVRFCCAGCFPAFRKDPQAYLSKLNPE
jgi:YHS domain-containing protein